MTHFKFYGDIDGISARQLEFISEVLEERGFEIEQKVKIENVGKAGDNYVALIKRIIVENEDGIFKMIAKVAPANEKLRASWNIQLMFHNEHVMYTEILPKFTELEKTAGVSESERLKYAICYGSLEEPPFELILLEDLNESNYFMKDRFVSLSDDAVKLVLDNFAKLHSLSYALKNKELNTYIELAGKLINMYEKMGDVPEMKIWMNALENEIITILVDEKHKKVLKGTVSQLNLYAKENKDIDEKSKFSVIVHGDAWTNNIMFVQKDNESSTMDCCIIDYQVSRLSSPAIDIHYMIFNCTDYETRSKHYYDWLDYYHDQLDKNLSNFGFKSSFIYPRDQFDAELKRCGKMGFCLSAMCATVILRETSEAAEMMELMEKSLESPEGFEEAMEKSMITASSKETVLKFKNRMEGLIDSFVEYGYL